MLYRHLVRSLCQLEGEQPYWNSENTEPRACLRSDPDSCPKNFTCQYSKPIDQDICCGVADNPRKLKRGREPFEQLKPVSWHFGLTY